MDEAAHDRVHLEVWSDVACPWCYVGRRNLRMVLEALDEADRPRVTWRAFQLDPSLPEDGVDADAYMLARFGDPSAIEQAHQRLELMGEEIGIEFRFDRRRTIPNTHFSHRVVAAAAERELHEPVLDALFAGMFERGVDIGDRLLVQELVSAAVDDPGLAAELCNEARESETLRAGVDEDVEQARLLGITGVPCFVADRRIAVPGAVPPPVLVQLLERARQELDASTDDD